MEVDISKKAAYVMKYGLIGMLGLAVLGAGLVWRYQHRQAGLTKYDALVAGAMVGVRARTDGKIDEILVKDGEKLTSGAVMAKVKVNVTAEEIQRLEQNLALAEQNLQEIQRGRTVTTPIVSENRDPEAQNRLAAAEARLQRMNELLEMGAVSMKQRDEAAANYEAAAAAASLAAPSITYQTTVVPSSPEAIKAAELQVRQAQTALKTAQSDSQATEITAPVEGTVYWKEIAPGSEIKAGQVVASVGDAANLWLEVKVKPADLPKIQLGQMAAYEINGREFNGTVTEISSLTPEAAVNTEGKSGEQNDAAAGEKISVIKISLASEVATEVKPGMKATVKITVSNGE